jgi:hypothetical protein
MPSAKSMNKESGFTRLSHLPVLACQDFSLRYYSFSELLPKAHLKESEAGI